MSLNRLLPAIALLALMLVVLGLLRAACTAQFARAGRGADHLPPLVVASAPAESVSPAAGRRAAGPNPAASDAQAPATELCLVAGHCRDTAGRAIPGARVAILAPGSVGEALSALASRSALATSDAQGAYELHVPRDRVLRVVARAAGYRAEAHELSTSAERVEVDFALPDGGVIQGTVRTRDGRRVVGAQIVARGRGAHGDAIEPEFFPAETVDFVTARSGDGGEFVVRGLRPGSYVLDVRAPGYRRTEPLAWGQSLVVATGDRVDAVLDPVGIVHGIAVDSLSGDIVQAARFAPQPASAAPDRPWFQPGAARHVTTGGATLPFLFGPPGAELCLHGVSPSQLPGAPEMSGHYIQVGECSDWQLGTAPTLRVSVTAPGYADAEVDLPVTRFEFGSVPPAVRIELVRSASLALDDIPVRFLPAGASTEPSTIPGRELVVVLTRETDPRDARRSGGFRSKTVGSGAGRGLPPDVVAAVERRLQVMLEAVAAGRAERLTRRVALDERGVGVLSALQPGRYTVSDINGLEAVTFDVPGATAPVVLSVARDPASDVLFTRWNGRVYVQVRDASGAPLPGVGVRLDADPSTTSELGGPVSWNGVQVLPPGSSHGSAPLRFDLPPVDVTFTFSRPGYAEQRVTHRIAGRGIVERLDVTMRAE